MPKKQSRYISQKVKGEVRRRDRDICQICGRTSEYMEFDHITPYSLGAPSTVENIQQLCRKCNGAKSNKTSGNCSQCGGWLSHDARHCHHCGVEQVKKQIITDYKVINTDNDLRIALKFLRLAGIGVAILMILYGVIVGGYSIIHYLAKLKFKY